MCIAAEIGTQTSHNFDSRAIQRHYSDLQFQRQNYEKIEEE